METTIAYWGNIGIMVKKWKLLFREGAWPASPAAYKLLHGSELMQGPT